MLILTIHFAGCGGSKVTVYEEARISSVAWAGDTIVAYSRVIERGFISKGMKRNPKQSFELWVGGVDPERGTIISCHKVSNVPGLLGRIEFFPGGGILLYAAKDGVWKVDLADGKIEEFFTHPSIVNFPIEIDVGPNETYTAIVVDAEGMPGSENLLDLFMVRTDDGFLEFHTDSLRDSKSFAWGGVDCINYITPDPWNAGKYNIMQFGVGDCLLSPSDMTEDEVLCNCPQPDLSSSGLWVARDNGGKVTIAENKE